MCAYVSGNIITPFIDIHKYYYLFFHAMLWVPGICNGTDDLDADLNVTLTLPLLTADIIEGCDLMGRSICSDYCNNSNAFRVSNDTADTGYAFAMLPNEEKLADFCACLEIRDTNCSAPENLQTCEDFCTGFKRR